MNKPITFTLLILAFKIYAQESMFALTLVRKFWSMQLSATLHVSISVKILKMILSITSVMVLLTLTSILLLFINRVFHLLLI